MNNPARYKGMTAAELHKQLQTLIVQSSIAVTAHQKATCSLGSFEVSYGNEERVAMEHDSYMESKKRMRKTIKLTADQIKRVNSETDKLTSYLDTL